MTDPTFRRVVNNNVTQTLLEVVDEAEQIAKVVIIVEYKKDAPEHYGFFDSEVTLADMNFLLDIFKAWMHAKGLGLVE